MPKQKELGAAGPAGAALQAVESLAEAAQKAAEHVAKTAEAAQASAAHQENIKTAKAEARQFARDYITDQISVEQALVQKAAETTVELSQAKSHLKEVLTKHSGRQAEWLVKPAKAIESNAKAADFAASMLSADKALQNDPYYLLQKGSELYWSTRWAELTPEAHRETRDVLNAVYHRVQELARVTPDFEVPETFVIQALLPEARMGMVNMGGSRSNSVYDENDAADTTLFTDPQIQNELRRIQHRIAFDKTYTRDSKELIADKRRIVDLLESNVPPDQVREAVNRIDHLVDVAERSARAAYEQQGRLVTWKEEWNERFRNHKPEGESIDLSHLSSEDIALLTSGEDGQLQWLSEFRQSIYEMGKGDSRPSFTDQMKFDSFERLVNWLWGDEYQYIPKRLKQRWESYERLDGIVKGLTYRPGPLEQKAKAFSFLTPHDIDDLLDYDLIELTKPLYSDSIKSLLENETIKYFDALEYLTTEVENPFNPGHMLTREELLAELVKRSAAEGHPAGGMGALTPEQDTLMREIRMQKDIVGNGVVLRDRHMLANQRHFEDLSRFYSEYNSLRWRQDHPDTSRPLTDADRSRMTELKRLITEKWKEYTLNPHADVPPEDLATLNAVRGYSPVEIEVRNRLVAILRADGLSDADIAGMEWKIRDAIWASRNLSVGMGEAMEIGAHMGIAPRTGDVKGTMVKYFMNGPFAEPVQRVLNESLFRDRFSMGGKLGEVTADLLYSKALERAEYDIMRDAPSEWKERIKTAKREGRPTWRIVMQYAQEELGISYSEIVRPEVLATGLTNISTNWRNETAVLDPIQERLLERKKADRLPQDAILDNEGLAIQFYIAHSTEERMKILERMMQRKPSAFFQLLGEDFHDGLERLGIDIRSQEWRQFQRALSMAEITTWRNQARRTNPFDFADWDDFNSVMPDMMRAAGMDLTANPDLPRRYHNAIGFMREYMHEPGPNNSATRIERWESHGFRKLLQIVSNDFNWKESEITRLGAYTLERRINDFMGMSKARDILFDFLYNKEELLSPLPGKETDSIMKIDEMREVIINYAGVDDAEQAASLLTEVWIDFNENRAARTLAGWLPGVVTLMKQAGYAHLEDMWFLKFIPGYKDQLLASKVGGVELHRLPKSVSQMVSYSVGLGGHEGNAWDEFEIARILAGMENRFMFVNNPHLLHALEKKYHTTFSGRSLATLRKYWFVVFAATVALAASQSVEEEQKKGGH